MAEPNETKPKTFVFVLMPFKAQYADVYEVGIKVACREAGAYCERVDEQIYDGSILARIYNQIAKADVIVADMTERNENVFYETGYAHALNKRVILLTQNADDIPFDLKHQPHIIYAGDGKIASLKSQLEPKIRWCIQNPQDSLPIGDLLQFFVNGILLENQPTIDASPVGITRHFGRGVAYLDLSVDIHNVTNRVLNPDAFSLAVVLPRGFDAQGGGIKGPGFRSMTRLPDGRKIHNIRALPPLFPQGWDTIHLQMNGTFLMESLPEVIIRVFTETGPRDYSFIVKPKTEESDESPKLSGDL
jgi:hypothetical protein